LIELFNQALCSTHTHIRARAHTHTHTHTPPNSTLSNSIVEGHGPITISLLPPLPATSTSLTSLPKNACENTLSSPVISYTPGISTERETGSTQTQRETDRDTERERVTERVRQRETQRKRESERERETETDRQTEKPTEGQTERHDLANPAR